MSPLGTSLPSTNEDEATLVGFLQNDGLFVQAIGGAIQRPGAHGTVEPIGFDKLIELMLEEAGGVEEKSRLDPNRPMPEPALHQAYSRGSNRWE